ncbi:bifunctional hydroxyacyl-CoA dehydrogenase/enoyl-CoA hydratase FOX2 [Sugiyamaella lignohabitans]|uniref:Bifunctional hydroxyacyl-CoA dehydrogenase/enoyl-CoA hydratase FOX2 n=1 Tax=Sugiyamaella lignohabitans TaxID=796027 RepID=A0A161HH07_9ASCO|nr:bifunctional hydroxyacyl-CoA dehydrogenase/enoyl-CoA hydratase FOX2 [Sugiyamaella lignohabitans]ANB15140.1 bifunctional hydroxyacyl-CoA dehydrogenase/enoyl-CoA hydratase FOX2 [Sugiyamaella lignohabitans]
MVLSLAGKIALVTGGSAGLGAEIVRQLAAQGCHVAVNYSASRDRAEELVESVKATHKVKALTLQGDVSQEQACKELVAETVKQLGGLDILISNAGWTRIINFADLDGVSAEDLDKTFAINVKAHFYLFREAKPHFEKNADGGSFIITASAAGLKPGGSSIPYSVSKAGSIHLAKCLAKAHGPKSRVNVICPGLLLTEWGQRFGAERIAHIENSLPLKYTSSLEDNADMFISVVKNKSMTGAVISVDSGMSLI